MWKRLGLAVYCSLALYYCLFLYYGPSGYQAYMDLSSYKSDLEENIAELQYKNNELEIRLSQLRESKERISIEARELGYLDENEQFIRVLRQHRETNGYSIGKLLNYRNPTKNVSSYLQLISVLAGLVIFLFLGSIMGKPHRQRV